MKRTIDEIYNIIIEKRENAVKDLRNKMAQVSKLCAELTFDELEISIDYDYLKEKQRELTGEIEAYTDVLCLIESSQILKEDNE